MNLRLIEFYFDRNQQKTRKARLNARKRVASVNSLYTADDAETDADAVSIAETETLDDEFYDCSDEELGGGDTDNGLVFLVFFFFSGCENLFHLAKYNTIYK